MPYTLGQAAKATGKQKSTILLAIKSGRLSANRDDLNQWQIDPAELHRVYEPIRSTDQPNTDQTALLNEKIRFLEQTVTRMEHTVDDLRNDRDHWRRQATYLLEHHPIKEATPTESPTEGMRLGKRVRSWLRWK